MRPANGASRRPAMAESATQTKGRRGWSRRHVRALLASVVVGAGFIWLLEAGGLPVVPARSAFSGLRGWTVPVYALIWLSVLLLRSVRWHFLLAPIRVVPLKRIVTVSLIGNGALILLPFRLGEIVRPAMIREKNELSGWAATGTVGAERIIDGLILSVLLLVTLPLASTFSPLPEKIGNLPVSPSVVPGAAYSAATLFAVAFLAMAVFYWHRDFARRTTRRIIGLVSTRLADSLSDAVERVASGFGFLPRLRYSGPYVLVTLVYWAVNVAGVEFLMWGVGLDGVTFFRACVVIGVLALGILVPSAPGFFGAFQLSLYAGLALFFAPDRVVSSGAAFVFIVYVAQMSVGLLAGLVSLLVEHVSAGDVVAADLEPE